MIICVIKLITAVNNVSYSESVWYGKMLLFLSGMGTAWHRGSILASHAAAPGLNPGTTEIFSLLCLVCEQN